MVYFGVGVVKRFSYKNRVMYFLGAAALAFLLFTYAVLSHVNFLGEMVLEQVEKAIRGQLDAEVSVSSFSGNPISGFRGETLVISRSGQPLVTTDSVTIDISLRSLFTGSPRIGRLVLDGLRSDYDSLLALVPEKDEDKGPVDIPVNKAVLNKSEIDTPWGLAQLDNSSVRPKNTEWFELDLSGTLASVPAAVKGTVSKKNGSWTLGGFKLKLAEGSATLSGPAFPVPDLELGLKNLELGETAKLIPSLKKIMIRGGVTGTMKITGRDSDFSVSGDGTLKNALIAGIPMSEVNAVWEYSKNIIDLKISRGSVFKSSVNGNFRLDSRGAVPYLTLDAKIANLDFSDWTDKIPDKAVLPYSLGAAGSKEAKNLSGMITSLEAELAGPLNALTGFVKLAPSSFGYKALKFTEIRGQAIFSGKPSGSVDFSALYKNSKMTMNGSLSFCENVESGLRFKADSLDLKEAASAIKGMEELEISGVAGVSAELSGMFGQWKVRGGVVSSQVSAGRYGVFKNIRLEPEYRFSDSSLKLARSSAEWNGAKLTAEGHLTPGEPMGLDFSGNLSGAETARFETLVPFFKAMGLDAALSGTWRAGGTLDAPTVAADIQTANAKFRGIEVKSFSGRLRYIPGRLTVEKADLRVGEGKALLSANVLFPQDSEGAYLPVVWSVEGTAANLPAAAIKGALGLEEPFDGTVSGSFEAGNGEGELAWNFGAKGQNLSWREFKADTAAGMIRGDASAIDIENMKVSFLRGEHVINGRVTLAGEGQPAADGKLELGIETTKLNIYELLRKHVPSVRGFQGLVKGKATVTGTIGEPRIDGAGTVAPLRFRSFLLPMVNLEFGGSLADIKVNASAHLREGTLKATARLHNEGGDWKAEVTADGAGINLNQIGRYLPEDFREKLAGNADFVMTGGGRLGAFTGEGAFKSNHMKIMNVDINNLNAPFFISEGYAIVEDVRAKSHGGDVTGGVAFDLAQNRWGGNVTITSADVDSFLKQATPQLPGTITGRGELKIRAGGETGRLSSVRASGVVRLFDGGLSKFSAVEAAQKFTRGNPIRFQTAQATFNYSGGFLTILPGSQAVAPKNDPVYRYMMLDGTVDENGVLALFAMGKANIQALNALLGALQGLMDLGIDFNEPLDKAELLQGIIGGALTGFSRNDFRFVTMGIHGTYDAPRFDNIRVQGKSQNVSEAIPRTPSDPKDDAFSSGNKTFKFRFEIPVGPGAAPGGGLDDQARGQILKNALDSLLQNADF